MKKCLKCHKEIPLHELKNGPYICLACKLF